MAWYSEMSDVNIRYCWLFTEGETGVSQCFLHVLNISQMAR